MRPSVLLALDTMLSMCFDQDKLLDMSTPRSLKVDTCSSMFSLIEYWVRVGALFLEMCMVLHFVAFSSI